MSDEEASDLLSKLSETLQQQAETLRKLSRKSQQRRMPSQQMRMPGNEDDILAKATEIGKRLRRNNPSDLRKPRSRKQPRVYEDVEIQLNVCEMTETRKQYKRSTGFVEVEVYKGDKYEEVTRKIAECLEISVEDDEVLALFKLNGTRILDKELTINHIKRPWLIGNYLAYVKKSAAQLKLGIGICQTEETFEGEVESTSSSGVLAVQNLQMTTGLRSEAQLTRIACITYMRKPSAENGYKVSLQYTREAIWSDILQLPPSQMDDAPFQPEDHGFMLSFASKIDKPDEIIVSFISERDARFGGFGVVCQSKENAGPLLEILVQSPKDIVVGDLLKSIPLVCIASVHGHCSYKWECVTDKSKKFSSVPILYVSQPGFFRCTVDVNGSQVKTHCIHVSLQPNTDNFEEQDIYHDSLGHGSFELDESGQNSSVTSGIGHSSTITRSGVNTSITSGIGLLKLTSDEVVRATEGKELLGKGGYGTVYLGYMRGTKVAVKYLNEEGKKALSENKKSTLVTEMEALSKFRHKNVLELMGFCENPACVVYEFVEKGSLYDCLHTEQTFVFDWFKRSKVLKGACRGLAWLHNNRPPLIHQDIKSSNVLITSHFEAKLGDFGFSIEAPTILTGKTVFTCPIVAFSQGYCAAEVAEEGKCSIKSDVYSYGVMVLETFTGLRAYDKDRVDKKLVEHMDDQVKDVELFKQSQDAKAGCAMEHYLVNIYHRLVNCCLPKHSRRSDTNKIMSIWDETNFD